MKKIAIFLVRTVSLIFRAGGMRACRFYPSCSEYSSEAFNSFGFLSALRISFARLFRCHPFSAGGYDPLLRRQETV